MIMRQGKICAEGWWAPYAPGIVHGLQSVTKTYAATAVGIAATKGLVRLNDRIIDIFPEESPAEPSENLRLLTVRDVLCMGCGMATMPRPTVDWISDFLATPVIDRPGTSYMYNSMGSTLLCAIVARVSGQPCGEFLRTELFDKIGIDSRRLLWEYMPDGIEVGGGGLYATTEDNLRLMKLYADGGLSNGERILSEEYVRLATSVQNESASEAKGNPFATDNFLGYGFQIWMCEPKGAYRADGAMGQFTVVVPEHDMILSLTETAAGAHWGQQTLDILWRFLDRIGPADQQLPADETAHALLRDKLNRLSLPRPPYQPTSPKVRAIDRKNWQIVSESFNLGLKIGNFMSGRPAPDDISSFSLRFQPEACIMTFSQQGRSFDFRIDLSGGWAENEHVLHTAGMVLLSGAWAEEDTFVIRARWVQTCFEKAIAFKIAQDDLLDISVSLTVGGNSIFTAGEQKSGLQAIWLNNPEEQ